MTISVMTALSAHVHPGKRSGTTYSIVKPSKGAPMSLVGPLPDKASGMTVSIAATLRMRNLPLQQCHKHRVLRLAHTCLVAARSLTFHLTTPRICKIDTEHRPHLHESRFTPQQSCLCLVMVENNAFLEGVVSPSYFAGFDDVVLEFAVVLSRTRIHLQGPSKSGYPTAMGVVHWTAGPMISQTALYSDCSGRSSNNVLCPTVKSPITSQPHPGLCGYARTLVLTPIARAVATRVQLVYTSQSYVEEALDPLPMFGWVMDRNEPRRRQDDFILRVATFLANDIPISSDLIHVERQRGAWVTVADHNGRCKYDNLSLYACPRCESAKHSGEAEYSDIHISASMRTVDFATTRMVLMYILAKSTVEWKRKKGAFALSREPFYTASLLKKATIRTSEKVEYYHICGSVRRVGVAAVLMTCTTRVSLGRRVDTRRELIEESGPLHEERLVANHVKQLDVRYMVSPTQAGVLGRERGIMREGSSSLRWVTRIQPMRLGKGKELDVCMCHRENSATGDNGCVLLV
ncbi:hypothetical protein EDD15DRAFT_2199324 [Pisolithus albus]|nr:hypothetical protein EDD15DRAFT_2199324 [Pisolithus albus]